MASAAVDLMGLLENSAHNKTNMAHFKQLLIMFEKSKIPYHASINPMPQDDKKTNKKPKKITSSNKYILFNTFVSKIKQPGWPNSYSLWNSTKADPTNATFLKIFNYIETITKQIVVKHATDARTNEPIASGGVKKNSKRIEYNTEEIEESNQKRCQYYHEFIEVIKKTYVTGQAPDSFIYDENLSATMLQRAVRDFKSFITRHIEKTKGSSNDSLQKKPLEQIDMNENYVTNGSSAAVVEEYKPSSRHQQQRVNEKGAIRKRKEQKKSSSSIKKVVHMASPAQYETMVNDSVYDSQMSD
ncbi:39 kDa protein [Leucania separata nucleopolyhedrovirus]|uniref:39 kDa protein n=1 Tax=Leucania separata nucleopolyhedrovirus TaxID=1307956 RepID=Q0IL83_NPVLS|nr:39 kDa protein [Leucania separata nucleopolyhedrovirus]AAR28800.1 39 kDa protein [Leucania separata nucleopolyhedrovirus]